MEGTYFLNGKRVTIASEFEFDGRELCVVYEGDEWFEVCRKSDLKKWEDTYHYQQEKKWEDRKLALEQYGKKIIERMQNKAIKGISNRIKFNTFFGGKSGSAFALVVADEINKLIKEEDIHSVDKHVQEIRKDTPSLEGGDGWDIG